MTFDPDALDEVLARLEDVGQLLRAQRNPGYPLYLISSSHREFDDTDALAADVCSVLKRRGDRFGNDEELRSYLDGDGVTYTPESLAVALRQLEGLGRIVRNRVDQFDPGSMLPGVYAEPRIIAGPPASARGAALSSQDGPNLEEADSVPAGGAQ